MVRKSNEIRSAVIQRLGEAVQLFQESTDEFDDIAAKQLGVNRTDLKCMGLILRYQPISPGEITRKTGLTKGATTTALDRLESAGYLKRASDSEDRRGVLLQVTPKAYRSLDAIWGPFVRNAERDLARYTTSELELIAGFLEEARKGQLAHAERIRTSS